MNLKIGDVVSLKSGGPTMIVKTINYDDVTCLWFNSSNELQEARFTQKILLLKTESNEKGIFDSCDKPIDDQGY